MRILLTLTTFTLFLILAGCGGDDSGAKGPLTDEQKKQVAIEDSKIADEESQGSVNKKKGKK